MNARWRERARGKENDRQTDADIEGRMTDRQRQSVRERENARQTEAEREKACQIDRGRERE